MDFSHNNSLKNWNNFRNEWERCFFQKNFIAFNGFKSLLHLSSRTWYYNWLNAVPYIAVSIAHAPLFRSSEAISFCKPINALRISCVPFTVSTDPHTRTNRKPFEYIRNNTLFVIHLKFDGIWNLLLKYSVFNVSISHLNLPRISLESHLFEFFFCHEDFSVVFSFSWKENISDL